MFVNQNIFRSYDIRGRYPAEINEEAAFLISKAFAKLFLKNKKNNVIVASDARPSSPNLKNAVISALSNSGIKVLDIGTSTTPMYYFAITNEKAAAGIMITASHNPPEYNGMKICLKNAEALNIKKCKNKIINEIKNHNYKINLKSNMKNIGRKDCRQEYINLLFNNLKIGDSPKLKIAIDASNGAASIVWKEIFKKLKNIKPVFQCFDLGKALKHPLDPIEKESQNHLKKLVKKERADFGMIFDGDADRIIFSDKHGNIIAPDSILALLSKQYLKNNEGRSIVYGSCFSDIVPKTISENGGLPEISKIGHTFIKEKMRETDADLGGEPSGHYFFSISINKKRVYFDAGILTGLKIIELITKTKKTFEDLIKPYRKIYKETTNIKLGQLNPEQIVQKLKNQYKNSKQETIDGLTVKNKNFWFNVRPSNTELVIRLTIEAKNEKTLKKAEKEVLDKMK